MSLLRWQVKYTVNSVEMDSHHAKLIDLIVDSYEAIEEHKPSGAIEKIVSKLVEYTEYHLRTEEEYMLKVEHSNTEEHMLQHNQFTEKIRFCQILCREGKYIEAQNLFEFLVDWFVNHIVFVDSKYTEEFKKAGI